MKRCCVPCCDNTSRRYSFPMENSIQSIWVERIKNPMLFGCDPVTLSKSYRVCGAHFADICKDNTGRLLKFSLPTLNLPDFQSSCTEEFCFSRPPKQIVAVTPPQLRAALAKSSMLETSPGIIKPVVPPIKTYSSSRKRLFTPDHPESSLEVMCGSTVVSVETESEPVPSTSRTVMPAATLQPQLTKTPRKGILRGLGVTRQASLSPREKILYKQTKALLQIISKRLNNKERKKKLNFFENNEGLLKYFKNLNSVTANFLMSQIRTQKYKPRGRRFSIDDKILALSIYKQSGRGYRFLSKIFSLPSRKVLSTMLNNIPFYTGMNDAIFSHLKSRVSKMKIVDRVCTLMFDEISLSSGLQYNARTDSVDGFVDSGGADRSLAFADHALIFMIRSINKKWKQTVCFTFCEGCTSTDVLYVTLKTIIRQIRNCGLTIIATICDQGATNQAAINRLKLDTSKHFAEQNEENRLQGYLVDDKEIVHIFDFPHLIKCIRNMLLTKQLHFVQEGVTKVASWSHVLSLYELDKSRGPYSQFMKLTDEHVIPSKIKKMKVKNCTQVFSHSVGTAMHVAAKVSMELSPDSSFYIDPKATHTADLLLFFDKLFDSVNGTSQYPLPGKELRTVVTKKSNHVSFWKSCIPVLSSMYFTVPNSEIPIKPPCLKNWVSSIRGLTYLTPRLFEINLNSFPPRSFNQDPVENFFSCIRSHGIRNTNPTCSSFISSCKSLLINNFISSHSVNANCENDDCIGALDNLRAFIEQPLVEYTAPDVPILILPACEPQLLDRVGAYTVSYVAGYVGKKVLQKVCCDICKKKMCSDQVLEENTLILERQYKDCHLIQPNTVFFRVFKALTLFILYKIPTLILCYGVKGRLRRECLNNYHLNILPLFCSKHEEIVTEFIDICVNVVFHSYITKINKVLLGKDLRNTQQDTVVKLAYNKYLKRCKK